MGWICALPIELAAAQKMLDEEHDHLEHNLNDNDENLYVLGSIGEHNVAIVCLPGRIGNNPATAVAMQMRATFKRLRFGLMVGIGGGVPTASDIRLGDVVVSKPDKTFAGVVQYDFGKDTPSGFERTGSLNAPPSTLLHAMARVQANDLIGRSKVSEYIAKLGGDFQRSMAGPDVLFEAVYDHEGGKTCDTCNPDRKKARQPRDLGKDVVVHYGTIASGNKVIKDAFERDKLDAELGGVLCFEMEAAGLMNSFPCLVVRGICDYADSHKNKKWQPYAAGAAAAYAKEVLLVIPPAQVAKTRTAEDAMQSGPPVQNTSRPVRLPSPVVSPAYGLQASGHSTTSSSSMSTSQKRKGGKKNSKVASEWSPAEDKKLLSVVQTTNPCKWERVAESIDNRSAWACQKRYEKVVGNIHT